MDGADASTVRLDRVEAGGDVTVSATTLHIFVGTNSRQDQTVSVAPDGSVRIAHAGGEPATAPDTASPYKGLEAFTEADADRFFGREAVIERLWQRYRALDQVGFDEAPLRLLPIIGPSGCGKSSLARAGLLPELARRPLPGLGNPRIAILVPSSHPIDSLTAVLARMVTNDPLPVQKQKEFADLLLADVTGENHALRRIVRFLTGDGRALVLLVDQFEEVWSLCQSSEERSAFIAGLLDVVADRDARVTVVLTLRSDFLSSTNAHPALSQAISKRAFLVPAMTKAELCLAIAEPARRANFTFDEATINLMVSETEGREGALPLLQFALTRIWEGLQKGVSAAETLSRLGGVGGALAKEAQRLYEELPKADQRIVRRAFLAQVRLGEGTRDSRRRAALDEIVAAGEDPGRVLAVLRVFSRPGERLITLGGEPDRGGVTAELTHEALLENWDNLRRWIAESRDDLRLQRRVTEAAEDWDAHGRPAGLLWRSPGLDLLRGLHRRNPADMTGLQIEFLKASERQQQRERLIRYGNVAAIFAAVLAGLLFLLARDYWNWERTRPWAQLINLASGEAHFLREDMAFVGRPTPGTAMNHQVPLHDQRISRIHLSISRTGMATDWRSLYGTTINGKPLPYANSRQLEAGNIIGLSGMHLFVFRPIDWRPWHYLRPPEFGNEAPSPGWAMLLNGQNHSPIVADEQFVTVRDDVIELTDRPTEDSALVVKRLVFRDAVPLTGKAMIAVPFQGERSPPQYDAFVHDGGQSLCQPAEKELSVLAVKLLPTANGRMESWLKEGDYEFRKVVLPSDRHTVFLSGPSGSQGIGEIIFLTRAGSFQIVPAATRDVAALCARSR